MRHIIQILQPASAWSRLFRCLLCASLLLQALAAFGNVPSASASVQATFVSASGSPFFAGAGTHSIATGDFNRDGKLDLIAAHRTANYLTYQVGNGDGTFTFAGYVPGATNQPTFVSTADFNLDGKLDYVVVNYGTNHASIVLGNGAGSFGLAPGSPYIIGSGGHAAAVGDFNRDGKPDLAIVGSNSNTVHILLGDGTGNFTQPGGTPLIVSSTPISVTTADFDRDGDLDLGIARLNAHVIDIYLGNGLGNFAGAASLATGNAPVSVTSGDVNRDENPDLVAANLNSNTVSVLLGNGSGTTFSNASGSPISVGTNPFTVVLSDLNADAKLDIAVTNQTSNDIYALLGDGSGGFSPSSGSPIAVGGNTVPLAAADVNRDGKMDLISGSYSTGTISVFLNNRFDCGYGNRFTHASGSPFSIGVSPQALVQGDFNRDAKSDLVVAQNGSTTLSIAIGNGNGTFTSAGVVVVGGAPYALVADDFNRDAKLDLAVTVLSSNSTNIYFGNGSGAFTSGPVFALGANPLALASSDWNNDGKRDLAVGVSGNVMLLLGDGTGNFSVAGAIPGLSQPADIAVGDWNRDGKTDLVVSDQNTSHIQLYSGNGAGGFVAFGGAFVGGTFPQEIATGDFNRDGNGDLAIAQMNSHHVSLHLGNGAGLFPTSSTLTGFFAPRSIAVTDANGDNKLDLIVGNYNDNKVNILLGDGAGGFSSASGSPVVSGSRTIAVITADWNRDGAPDIGVSNNADNTASALLNQLPIDITLNSVKTGNWSSAETWDCRVPGDGDSVKLTSGQRIYLDTDTAMLKNVTINGELAVQTSQRVNLTGDWTNNGTFYRSNGSVIFQGSGTQTIGGTSTTDFATLYVLNTLGSVTLNTNASVNQFLGLTGDLTISNGIVLTQNSFSVGDGDVVGSVRRTNYNDSFGNSANTIKFTSGTPPSEITVTLAKAAPSIPNALARIYTITPDVNTGWTADLTLRYTDAEVSAAGATESDLSLYRHNGTSWVDRGGTVNTSSNNVFLTGVGQFSDWALAPNTPTSAVLLEFSGKAKAKLVTLKWSTGSELNLIGFNVWRKVGKREWMKLNTETIAAQNTGQIHGATYRFSDQRVKPHKTYRYRLELLKVDGSTEMSDVIKISIP